MKTLHMMLCVLATLMTACSSNTDTDDTEREMLGLYGKNMILADTVAGHPSARTATGIYVGSDSSGVFAFKGIEYAQQPVGDMRWKVAKSLPADSFTVKEALYFGKSAVQSRSRTQPASFYPQGEDCLTLSVWTTSTDTASRRPVMVWIHGGSYGWGGTADPLFDGHNMVRSHPDIVLVSINYRLGLLGFIDLSSFEGGEDYPESANLGIYDQISALQWIKRNIAAFGGNPDNITIFGESAGGGSVSILCIAPQAKGLFGRAIAESGSPAFTSDKTACADLARRVKEKTDADSVAQLLALDYDRISALNDELTHNSATFPRNIIAT